MSAMAHFLSRQAMKPGRINQGDRIAERQGNIKLMGREKDTFSLLMS